MADPNFSERVSMALFELGVSVVSLIPHECEFCGGDSAAISFVDNTFLFHDDSLRAKVWKAASISQPCCVPCWSCFKNGTASTLCAGGDCQDPNGEKIPPRELVLA